FPLRGRDRSLQWSPHTVNRAHSARFECERTQPRRREVGAHGFGEEIGTFGQIGCAVRVCDARLACARAEELCGAYVALADERRKQTTACADAARFCLKHKPRESWMKR